MDILNARKRWIWSEMEHVEGFTHLQPVAREYAMFWVAPFANNEHELVHATMTLMQLSAAQSDHRLVILESLRSSQPIPADMATAFAPFGVTAGMTLPDALEQLGKTEPKFLSEY